MPELKLLKFYLTGSAYWRYHWCKILCEGLESLPDELRYVSWPRYPLKSLPLKPEHLVDLEMPHSKLQHLWKDTKSLGKLRRIDLSECGELTEVPDLSQATNLDSMELRCCSSLTKFPKISSTVTQLCLCGTAIEEVPDSAIKSLSKIVELDISSNTRLRNLPSMRHLTSLERLHLYDCSNITKFPEISGAITFLDLSGTAIEEEGRDSFCFPGSEIPEWFINQNQGSSIKIDLPPHWYSNKFVGFVVCIVASCESSNHIDLSSVKCNCKIKDPDCDWQDITFRFPKTVIEHPKSDHVFIKSIMPDSVRVDFKSDQNRCIRMTDGIFNTENSFSWQKARFGFSTSKACYDWRYDRRTALDDWRYNKWRKEMNKVKIIGEGLESLPDELRYVSWPGYPLRYLPLKPEHLVDLEMPFSKLQHLWKDTKFFGKKLRRIDLRECRQLTEVPDLYQATNLESMQLGWCSTLTKFPKFSSHATLTQLCLRETAIEEVPYSAIKCLSKIVELDISSNTRLRNLPSMRHLISLETLYLYGCSNITEFPDVSGAITRLYLSGTGIEEVPYSAIKSLSKIDSLDISSNRRLRNLPSMRHLTPLKFLFLDGCSNITEFPDVSEKIVTLCLRETGIEEVPSFVERLTYLQFLTLDHCKRLKKVSSCIFQLKLGWGGLDLSGCSKLENFVEVLENEGMLPSSRIRELSLRYCKNLNLESLPKLSKLDLTGCPGVEKKLENVLLSSPSDLCSLKELDLSECNMGGRDSFCFPGSEILEWFIFQNLGSSIKIDLPPHWYRYKFVGFVVCIVASCDSQSSNPIGHSYVKCECKIKDPDYDGQDITFNFPETVIQHPESDHVFIKSIMPSSVLSDRKSDYGSFIRMSDPIFNTENPFCFGFSTSKGCCKVKKCGINLVYSEREDQVFETESEEEDCHSESEDQVFETVLMSSQRKKRKIAT
ncbi:hypothetical protein LWI29_035998 [Acer saccharum]|uniref:C-JID domain-containing protein n=1 Tax=Acer saccharum TaxID=4024 RepID=A0AA39SEG8_ACESA|nr:hypothetical protein LWI29_035998 [Acer saccharum]